MRSSSATMAMRALVGGIASLHRWMVVILFVKGLCQCVSVGIGVSGSPWHRCLQVFEFNRRCSQVKTHYPNRGCNKHTMIAHIATRLIRSVFSMLACAPPGRPRLAPRKFRRKKALWNALLSKEEMQGTIRAEYGIEGADLNVQRFLGTCEARRSMQRPPPKRISWENRPKWDGSMINLAPVVDGAFVVFSQARR